MRQALKYDKLVRPVAIFTLAIFVLYGLVLTLAPLLPFWIDEWLLIDNLKFKSSAQLWKALDHTQQFPRVYLQLIKSWSAACDYSYLSLRLPSFIAHCLGLTLLYKLSGRIFTQDSLTRFLWVMIYVSYSTSIHYFVQLKQYTMEMAMSLVAIWQLLELIRSQAKRPSGLAIFLLCVSFAICPFFSYTYPIVVAPIYLIVALRSLKAKQWSPLTWLPLFIGIVSVLVFYQLDVRHVLADKGMQDFWKDLLMKTFSLETFFTNTYMMFCNLGSGDLFGNIFGVLGASAFLYSSYVAIKTVSSARSEMAILIVYSSILIWVILGLFVAGKLPLGTFRLNSFTVPAVGLMIVNMLAQFRGLKRWKLPSVGFSLIIFLACIGNVYAVIGELAGEEHRKKMRIYQACDRAILEARRGHLPMFVTSGIAYPFDDRWPGDWILKTHPRYKVYEPLQVYAIPGVDVAGQLARAIPGHVQEAIILDGDSVRTMQL